VRIVWNIHPSGSYFRQLAMRTYFLLLILISAATRINGTAKRPPMGWLSWDAFLGSPTEEQFKQTGEYVNTHLKSHGYEYLVIDAGWYANKDGSVTMDKFGRVMPGEISWPSNNKTFKAVSEWVHSLGLKFGFHVMRGVHKQAVLAKTQILGTNYTAADIAVKSDACFWWTDWYGVNITHPAAAAWYQSNVDLYAEWDTDFIKVDCIFARDMHRQDIIMISDAIEKTGHDFVFSLSPGPNATAAEAESIGKYVNMYRMTDDFWDCWDTKSGGNCNYVSNVLTHFEEFPKFVHQTGAAGRNGSSWPDGDSLPFGYITDSDTHLQRPTKLTQDEQRTTMTLWTISRSPLFYGGDVLKMDPWTLALITNDEVLEIQKNSIAGGLVAEGSTDTIKVFQADHARNGVKYVAIFNVGPEQAQVDFYYKSVKLGGTCAVRDLWAQTDLGTFRDSLNTTVPSHGTQLYAIQGCK